MKPDEVVGSIRYEPKEPSIPGSVLKKAFVPIRVSNLSPEVQALIEAGEKAGELWKFSCPFGQCDGSGSYAEHAHPHEEDCRDCPVQVQCECEGRWAKRAESLPSAPVVKAPEPPKEMCQHVFPGVDGEVCGRPRVSFFHGNPDPPIKLDETSVMHRFEAPKPTVCRKCGGSGLAPGFASMPCPTCNPPADISHGTKGDRP